MYFQNKVYFCSMLITRNIKKQINFYATKYPIIGLTGPRQSGKTTLLRKNFSDYRYVSLENPDMREYATQDAVSFLKEYDDKVILDEVQCVPSLFSYLQTKVDEEQKMGQYILSGSQNFKLLHSVQQSLSGRIGLFKLFPFDFNELKQENLLNDNAFHALQKGFYPAIFDRDIPSENYYSNYVETYIERDINDWTGIANLHTFRQFIKLCAHSASQVLNLNDISKKCGISHPTAKAWLNVLESSYIVFLLPPYFNNFSKRIIKSPKLYFYDTGLLCFLLGLTSAKHIENQTIKGHLFENMIIAELIKQQAHQQQNAQFYFWRDSNKKEVDLIIEKHQKISLAEIKSTATISQKLFKNINDIAQLFPDKVEKQLIFSGEKTQNRTDIKIIDWQNIAL